MLAKESTWRPGKQVLAVIWLPTWFQEERTQVCAVRSVLVHISLSWVFSLGINTLVFWFYQLLVWAGLHNHRSCCHCRRLSQEAWRKALDEVSYLCEPVWSCGQRPNQAWASPAMFLQSRPGTETELLRSFPCDFGKASVAALRKIKVKRGNKGTLWCTLKKRTAKCNTKYFYQRLLKLTRGHCSKFSGTCVCAQQAQAVVS